MVVHFPIALFVTALLFDLACLVWRRSVWLDRAAVSLYVLGVLCAGGAALTGKLGANNIGAVSAEVELLIGDHSDWAFLTLITFLAVTLIRFEVAWRDRKNDEVRLSRIRMVALGAALVGQWVLFQTADRGAALVYQHGVGVSGDVGERSYARESPSNIPARTLPKTSNGGGVR
jgi:uncharacterized membrane protein